MAVPGVTGKRVSSGVKKFLGKTPASVLAVARGVACTSQPKTLLAGSALGLSNTVSVPVRVRLNTDGAVVPACSAERMGRRCAQGLSPTSQGRKSLFVQSNAEPGSSRLLERTHGPPMQHPLLLTHEHRPLPSPPKYSPHSRMTWYVLDLISWFLLRFPRAPFKSSSFTGGRFFLMGAS